MSVNVCVIETDVENAQRVLYALRGCVFVNDFVC